MAVQGEDIKIPVFSVLKNGIILKNIFLNNPKWESKLLSDLSSLEREQERVEDDDDDPVLIGRHPDCHIVLDHPSISRFHLEIRAKPTSQKLYVIDRSSVHGTWVSGNKIQPNVDVILKEGDTVRLGASTRIYKLHWVPLNCAFEMENSLPSLIEENEETHQLENLNEGLLEEIPSAPPIPISFSQPLECENQCPKFCSDALIAESIGSSVFVEEEHDNDNEVQSERDYKSTWMTSCKKGKSLSILSRRSKSKLVSSLHIQTGRNKENRGEKNQETDAVVEECKREEPLCRVLFDNEKENQEEETFISPQENVSPLSSMSRRSHKRVREILSSTSAILTMREESSWSHEAPSSMKYTRLISANNVEEEDEVHDSDKENSTPVASSHHKLRKSLGVLQISSSNVITDLSDEEDAIFADKENWTPEMKSKKLVHMDLQQFNGEEQREVFLSDKENMTPEFSGSRKSKKPLSRNIYKVDGEEAFFSDKENVTPNASGANNSKRELTDSQSRTEREIIERRKDRIPFQCLLENCQLKSGSHLKHAQRTAEKERTPFRPLIEKSPSKKCSPLSKENAPFHSLMESSPLKLGNPSPLENAQITGNKGNICSSFTQTQKTEAEPSSSFSLSVDQVLQKAEENKKRWLMVVDTGCFLNEESRKALQLLEGIKGTQLIIPRIVIRELDCLHRRESLFRKNRKVASSVLQWIEDCMVRSRWWIHVQSSSETIPVAPTPPATPRSELGDGSNEICIGASNSVAFSTCRSLMEIVSPTAEDHILDCAILFKGMKDDGQLVLLTDSVTLKIKAMAEGLLCETPCEFRESLVNPYSKRFLWSDSIPRGSTWSCLDEVGAIENYRHQLPNVRKTANAAQSIRGLKLILLHNSLYGMTSSVT